MTAGPAHAQPTWLAVSLLFLAVVNSSCSGKPAPVSNAPAPTSIARTAVAISIRPLPTKQAAVSRSERDLSGTAVGAPPTSTVVPTIPAATPLNSGRVISAPRRTQYILNASLDYQQHSLTVSGTVSYTNQTTQTLSALLLVVESNRDAGVFRLNHLNWPSGGSIQGYTLDGVRLNVPLSTPLVPGNAVGLDLSYQIDLPSRPGPFGYTARQANLGVWYPFVPAYRPGQGWLVHEAADVGGWLVFDVADFQVDFEIVNADRVLMVAASAAAERQAGNRYHYRLDSSRSFTLSISPDYQVLHVSAGSVPVVGYVFPEHHLAGEAALKATSQALQLYSSLFGPYQHSSLVMVEADFSDGLEYDGLYFLGQDYFASYDGTPKGYLTAIAVHETSHQWWSGVVGNDVAMEPWLSEAMAIYSERLYYEAIYPDLVAWWWNFRVDRFVPTGWVDSTIYDHFSFRPYVNAVYLRGAHFLEDLRRQIGDEAFFAFLQDYTTRYAGRVATAQDFFATLASHTSADVHPLIQEYFRTVGR